MARCPECQTDWDTDWYKVSCKTCTQTWADATARKFATGKDLVDRLRKWQPTARLIVIDGDPCPSCHRKDVLLHYTIDEGTGAWCSACRFSNAHGGYSVLEGYCPQCGEDRLTLHERHDVTCSACLEAVEEAWKRLEGVEVHVNAETAQWLDEATPEAKGAFQRMLEGAVEMAKNGEIKQFAEDVATAERCPECTGVKGSNTGFCTTCQRHAGVYCAEGW